MVYGSRFDYDDPEFTSLVDRTNAMIQMAGSPSIMVTGRMKARRRCTHASDTVSLTGVQHLSLGGAAGEQPEALPQDVLRQQGAELTLVRWCQGDAEPADLQRIRGRVPGPAAKSGGQEALETVWCTGKLPPWVDPAQVS